MSSPMALNWEGLVRFVQSAPQRYMQWWLNLVQDDPGHVIVETALILFVVYILVLKKTTNTGAPALGITHLTPKEVEDLITEWTPEPLVPDAPPTTLASAAPVVERLEGDHFIVRTDGGGGDGGGGCEKRVLNMASFDFLGFGNGGELKAAAVAAMERYGCGSCGPRGFYGTIDAHLRVEDQVAAFMGTEAAISYSDSAVTVSSCIAAFAKRGDLILADGGVQEPVLSGLDLSRSTVRYFKHNDMEDLQRLLEEVEREDVATRRRVLDQRRFIVVEGLYRNYGDLCPLPKLLQLKEKYHYRLLVDEGLSFGVLGATGRGVTEHFGVPVESVDITTISLAHTLASIGGMCVGRDDVVDHQRLSGAGYCFSASAPPFTAAAAGASLQLLRSQGPQLLAKLRANASRLRAALLAENFNPGVTSNPSPASDGESEAGVSNASGGAVGRSSPTPGADGGSSPGAKGGLLRVLSAEESPLVHVALAGPAATTEEEHLRQRHVLERIADALRAEGFAVCVSRYLRKERHHPPPTIRLAVHATHTEEQLDACAAALNRAARDVLQASKP